MTTIPGPNILAKVSPEQYVGRSHELERLLAHARSGESSIISLLKAPGSGATELLCQLYDRLFHENGEVIPVYFAVRPTDTEPAEVAERFQRDLVSQILAFSNRDLSLVKPSAELSKLASMAQDEDRQWVTGFLETAGSIRKTLAAPLRTGDLAGRLFVMIDDIDNAATTHGGDRLVADLIEIARGSGVPYVIAGARRYLFGKAPGRSMDLETPTVEDAAKIVAVMSERYAVAVNEQTRDLIAVQMSGNLRNIEISFAGAAQRGEAFENFAAVESAYAEEIFGGRLARSFESQLDRAVPDAARTSVMELFQKCLNEPDTTIALSEWRDSTGVEAADFRRMTDMLHASELLNCSGSRVSIDAGNTVLTDLIAAFQRLESEEPRALVFGESLSHYMKRAPQLLGRYYRRKAALGLKALLSKLEGQHVPAEMIDYGKYKAQVKGRAESDAAAVIEASSDKMKMPSIFFAADTSAFYKRLAELIDDERSAIALGFEDDSCLEESVWIAAQIDSKLEADRGLTEFWCDRLEMVAATCGFAKFTIWLVAPEGFADEALEVLRSRGAIGSSSRQFEMLRNFIFQGQSEDEADTADEYEMIIPMGDDTELIAARTLEDIARKHDLPQKTINQIKTALVEACINAEEHSLSPDRRIYQKFSVNGGRLTMTVANRGLRLLDRQPSREIVPDEGRRGWGLKLMKSLMDEVTIEASDDGTRITLVKFLPTEN